MTSDLGSEDVVVRITTPQIISAETIATVPSAAAGRAAASSVAVEMGRRMLVAARAGDTQLVLDLMAQGAPFTTDWLGTSPLHLAANNGHVDTCAVLLRAGVSRDSRTKVERTPLHLAAYAGHAHVAALLLENGALVDCRDMLRMTPLHWAVARGHASVAAVLVRHGAEPRALSKFQKTPLSLATEVGRDDLLRLLEEAARAREAAVSVDALVGEQMTESATEPQLQTFDAVRRLHEILPNKVKQLPETNNNKSETTKTECIEEGSNHSGEAAQLLRKHGITLLPHDTGSTVLNALQSGRTVVLSDAGKLLLKESSEPTPTASKLSTVASSTSANQPKGVVLTATPVKSPPKPGVKIFTLNNKLLAMPKESNKIPIKKVINPHDMQIKFVQLPPDAKIISPLKTKNRLTTFSQTHTKPHMITRPQAQSKPQLQAAVTPTTPQRPAVKIIMNKANFNKLMANANKSSSQNGIEVQASPAQASSSSASGVEMEAGSVVCVPEEFLRSTCPRYLRAQLLAAHRALADLNTELHACKARLASLERP